MIILTFILIAYGACNSIIYGSIFEGFRNFLAKFGTGGYSLYKLFTCFMCLPVHMGFALTVIYNYFGYTSLTPMGSLGFDNIYLMTFLNGLMTGGCVWLINTVQDALDRTNPSN